MLTRNPNRVIDVNYYPIPEARNSNMRHRPVGIGVQGLADAFILMGLAFDRDRTAFECLPALLLRSGVA